MEKLHYLIVYKNQSRESFKDLTSFYDKYMEIHKNGNQKKVQKWCSVENSHIRSLSDCGLDKLFLRATEPNLDGYVVYQILYGKKEYYLSDGGITENLKDALILPKKLAERELYINKLFVGIRKCSITERNNGVFEKIT